MKINKYTYENVIRKNQREIERLTDSIRGYPVKGQRAITEKIAFLQNRNAELKSIVEYLRKTDEELNLKNATVKERIKVLNKLHDNIQGELKKKSRKSVRDVVSSLFNQLDKRVHNKIYHDSSKQYPVHKGNFLTNIQTSLFMRQNYRETLQATKELYNPVEAPKRSAPVEKELSDKEIEKIINEIKLVDVSKLTRTELSCLINRAKRLKTIPNDISDKYKFMVMRYHYLLDITDNDSRLYNYINKINNVDLEKARKEDLAELVQRCECFRDHFSKNIMNKFNKIKEVLKQEEDKKIVNIDNYAVIDRYNIVDLNYKMTNDLTFSKALKIVRDKNLHTEEEWINSMKTITGFLGSGKGTKKKTDPKKLNDFLRTEKLIAEYGRKLRNNEATAEDKLIYQALVYHLAKVDVIENFNLDTLEEDINDYIADEAVRYAENKRKILK